MILRILLTAFQCGKLQFASPEVFISWVLITHCILHSDCDSVVCSRSQTTKKVMHHSLVADYRNGSRTLSITILHSIVEVLPSNDSWSLPGYPDIPFANRNGTDILTVTWRFCRWKYYKIMMSCTQLWNNCRAGSEARNRASARVCLFVCLYICPLRLGMQLLWLRTYVNSPPYAPP